MFEANNKKRDKKWNELKLFNEPFPFFPTISNFLFCRAVLRFLVLCKIYWVLLPSYTWSRFFFHPQIYSHYSRSLFFSFLLFSICFECFFVCFYFIFLWLYLHTCMRVYVCVYAYPCAVCTLTISPSLCLSIPFCSVFFYFPLRVGGCSIFSYKRIFSLLNVAFTFDLCKMQCRLRVLDSAHLCLFNVLYAQVFLILRGTLYFCLFSLASPFHLLGQFSFFEPWIHKDANRIYVCSIVVCIFWH